jgi:hypothetical protein
MASMPSRADSETIWARAACSWTSRWRLRQLSTIAARPETGQVGAAPSGSAAKSIPSKDRCLESGPRQIQRLACDLRRNDIRCDDVRRTCAQLTILMLEPTLLLFFGGEDFSEIEIAQQTQRRRGR